uniref:BTB domain-containing protein n=1 Tax=Arcella intermedia TaxID=1963864 RepID=A0A6B2LFW4_9EUKA
MNVGGKLFLTTRETLTKLTGETFFSVMLSGRVPTPRDERGYYFIDRNPKYFEPILDYMRTGEWRCPFGLSEEYLLKEADYYMIRTFVSSKQEIEKCSDQSLEQLIQSVLKSRSDTLYKQELKTHQHTWEKLERIITTSYLHRARQGRRDLESPLFITKATLEYLLNHFKNTTIGTQLLNLKIESVSGISDEFVVSYPCYVMEKTNFNEQGFLRYMKKRYSLSLQTHNKQVKISTDCWFYGKVFYWNFGPEPK